MIDTLFNHTRYILIPFIVPRCVCACSTVLCPPPPATPSTHFFPYCSVCAAVALLLGGMWCLSASDSVVAVMVLIVVCIHVSNRLTSYSDNPLWYAEGHEA